MRRRLVLVFVGVSTLVALAFVVPLGFLVRRTAEDRAIDAARADANAIVPVVVAGSPPERLEAALAATTTGREGRLTVVTSDGTVLGPPAPDSARLAEAIGTGASSIGGTTGGVEVVIAVASGGAGNAAVRAFVPSDALHQGQWQAWGALGAVGLVLVAISVGVADRLSRSVVGPTEEIARMARRIGDGDLAARVELDGPDELVELAAVLNELGGRVESMLQRERELVAELSHRLRTPLTQLRLRAEQLGEPGADPVALSAEIRAGIDSVRDVLDTLIGEARGAIATAHGCDAADVVRDRAEFWSVLAEDQGRAWTFISPSERLPVRVAASDLAAAIDVVIDNVFTHTPQGSPVRVGACLRGPHATVWVDDGGPGFAEGAIARGVSGAGSTGLGLAIARRLAESAGGSFQVTRSDLGGARVELELPVDHGI